jgi:O-antigen ligase
MRFGVWLTGSRDGVAWLAVLLILASGFFGGASHGNAPGTGFIGLVACPLLALSLWKLFSTTSWRRSGVTLALIALCWAVLLAQLVPVPANLYAAAPGREQALAALDLAGVRPTWLPLSMNPDATWGAMIGAIAPTAMLLALLCIARPAGLAPWYLGLAGLGIGLGVAQHTLGDSLHPYGWTWPGAFSGVFANANHFATLLLALLPISVVWLNGRLAQGRTGGVALKWLLSSLIVFVAAIALVAIGSRFGVLMAIPVGALTLWIVARREGNPGLKRTIMAGALVTAIAVSIVAPLAMPHVIDRFIEQQPGPSRPETWSRVLGIARTYLPLGAGAGSFDRVYRAQEHPLEVGPTYLNEAHNDYLQLLLEGGWAAVLLCAVVVAAVTMASVRVWRRGSGSQGRFAKAATVGLLVIGVHSVVDYPLRTPAIAVLATFLLGAIVRFSEDSRMASRASHTPLPRRQ